MCDARVTNESVKNGLGLSARVQCEARFRGHRTHCKIWSDDNLQNYICSVHTDANEGNIFSAFEAISKGISRGSVTLFASQRVTLSIGTGWHPDVTRTLLRGSWRHMFTARPEYLQWLSIHTLWPHNKRSRRVRQRSTLMGVAFGALDQKNQSILFFKLIILQKLLCCRAAVAHWTCDRSSSAFVPVHCFSPYF